MFVPHRRLLSWETDAFIALARSTAADDPPATRCPAYCSVCHRQCIIPQYRDDCRVRHLRNESKSPTKESSSVAEEPCRIAGARRSRGARFRVPWSSPVHRCARAATYNPSGLLGVSPVTRTARPSNSPEAFLVTSTERTVPGTTANSVVPGN